MKITSPAIRGPLGPFSDGDRDSKVGGAAVPVQLPGPSDVVPVGFYTIPEDTYVIPLSAV